MTRSTALLIAVLALAFCALAAPWPMAARAEEACTAADYAAAIDRSGAALRKASQETQPQLQERMRRFQAAKGLSDGDYETAAFAAIEDKKLADFDEKSSTLLLKIDGLGRLPAGRAPVCAEVADIDAMSKELLATVRAKSAYMLARLDAEIAAAEKAKDPTPAAADKAAPKEAAKEKPAPRAAKAEPEATSAETAAPPASGAPAPSAPAAEAKAGTWSAETSKAKGNDAYVPPPPDAAGGVATAEGGYSIDEIQEATRGFFGTISTSLASVIEHAFKTSGRPAAYVLGTEGGGAFLAGLRFGSGTLFMRNRPETRKVWWHGPSIGGDFGADGTRTMFLIYHLESEDALYRSFTGVDGSAFFVGGVGMTVLKGGDVIMAPIRTGLGLRVGASIGYVRFTDKATWNPF